MPRAFAGNQTTTLADATVCSQGVALPVTLHLVADALKARSVSSGEATVSVLKIVPDQNAALPAAA